MTLDVSNIATEAAESTTQPSDVLNTDLTELLDFSAADNELNLDESLFGDQAEAAETGQVGEQSTTAADFAEVSLEPTLLAIELHPTEII